MKNKIKQKQNIYYSENMKYVNQNRKVEKKVQNVQLGIENQKNKVMKSDEDKN